MAIKTGSRWRREVRLRACRIAGLFVVVCGSPWFSSSFFWECLSVANVEAHAATMSNGKHINNDIMFSFTRFSRGGCPKRKETKKRNRKNKQRQRIFLTTASYMRRQYDAVRRCSTV